MSASEQPARLDVIGFGNAIVDVIAEADDRLLERLDLAKGTMTLIERERMAALYARMGPAREMSGGSCANTMAALAALGADVAYVGKVQDDQLGEVFAHDIRAAGVEFLTRPLAGGPPTARCLVLVTPDAQRTMATYLGACVELGPDDVDEAQVAAARIVYLEGYLWDRPGAKAACLKAAEVAHRHGRQVALTLSDPFCVARWRDEFIELIAGHVDILIANEAEICSLYQTNQLEPAVERARRQTRIAALTRSADGSVLVGDGRTEWVPAAPVARVVDSTGAGDLYAAGLLYGLTHGLPLAACGRLGGLAAAEVLSHLGARPERPLAPLVAATMAG
jgi:sugar/nucleoside kinase (ribokinase family)